MVTSLSSTCISLVRKSAPIVALYWLENFLLTYWFMREVFPTPESPAYSTQRSQEVQDHCKGDIIVDRHLIRALTTSALALRRLSRLTHSTVTMEASP